MMVARFIRGRSCAVLAVCTSVVLLMASTLLNGPVPRHLLLRKVRELEGKNRLLLKGMQQQAGLPDAGEQKKATVARSDEGCGSSADPDYLPHEACETIHVALVVGGYNATRQALTVIKSMLFYRHNPLHFHFLADKLARPVLRTVFNTWQLPDVSFSLYETKHALEVVSWIGNYHYSGIYGLMKLCLPQVLPGDLPAVLVLDTDVTVVSDVAQLWRVLSVMRKDGRLLGLVENQSDWYLGTLWQGHRPWPALGRGFNTGVMLMNLQAIRSAEWYDMWSSAAMETRRPVALADQDIINTAIKKKPGIVHLLPCLWNVQLSEHSLSNLCYREAREFKIIHWNSPDKQAVKVKHSVYFRNLFLFFEAYDGYLLREGLVNCQTADKGSDHLEGVATSAYPQCTDFMNEYNTAHRIHPFFLEFNYWTKDSSDVVLITQLSMDRVGVLNALCKQWGGSMSVSLFASDWEAQMLLRSPSSIGDCYRNSIAVHLVYRESRWQPYPVNLLRNTALEQAASPHVFLSDVDFLPVGMLCPYLRQAVDILDVEHTKRALVIPAFETQLYKCTVPQNKTVLLEMLDRGTIQSFRHDVWPRGHAPTNYKRWREAIAPYKVDWAQDYEPYIVTGGNVTRYDARFVGFGWNKVSHIMELYAQGYEFLVLPEVFIVHTPHSSSADLNHYRASAHYRDCMQLLKKEFQKELVLKYGEGARKY